MDSRDRPSSGELVSRVDALPSAAMVTQYEAASYLGVSPAKVGLLVFHEHLKGSRYGVTVGSVRKESSGALRHRPARRSGEFCAMLSGRSWIVPETRTLYIEV